MNGLLYRVFLFSVNKNEWPAVMVNFLYSPET